MGLSSGKFSVTRLTVTTALTTTEVITALSAKQACAELGGLVESDNLAHTETLWQTKTPCFIVSKAYDSPGNSYYLYHRQQTRKTLNNLVI